MSTVGSFGIGAHIQLRMLSSALHSSSRCRLFGSEGRGSQHRAEAGLIDEPDQLLG